MPAGAIQVVCNCALLTEGFDLPAVATLVIARPTLFPGLYMQMLGRGMRKAEGKTDCLVLDVVGNQPDPVARSCCRIWSASQSSPRTSSIASSRPAAAEPTTSCDTSWEARGRRNWRCWIPWGARTIAGTTTVVATSPLSMTTPSPSSIATPAEVGSTGHGWPGKRPPG